MWTTRCRRRYRSSSARRVAKRRVSAPRRLSSRPSPRVVPARRAHPDRPALELGEKLISKTVLTRFIQCNYRKCPRGAPAWGPPSPSRPSRDTSSSHRRRETTPSTAWSGRTRARSRSAATTWASAWARPSSTRSCAARCGPTSWPVWIRPRTTPCGSPRTTNTTGAAPGSISSTAARRRSSARATRSGSRRACASTSPRSSRHSAGRLVVNGVALVGERGRSSRPPRCGSGCRPSNAG